VGQGLQDPQVVHGGRAFDPDGVRALPYLKDEGAATQFDNNAGERFTWAFVHIEVALGYAITRKAIDDNLYKAQFNPTNLKLQEAFAQFKEIQAANILNTGTTYNSQQVGDGVAFFSTSHPYDGGTWANTSTTPKSLNESTLLANMTNVRTQFVNERGLRILARARRLIVPPNLEASRSASPRPSCGPAPPTTTSTPSSRSPAVCRKASS
jgi:hypothetical protein